METQLETEIPPEDIFSNLADELFHLNYRQTDEIVAVEQRIYGVLHYYPDSVAGLVTLMLAQTMLGDSAKAKALAYKIWETGGKISPFFELLFIENLLAVGMLDKALILLKPRFEDLSAAVNFFYPVLIKFAVITGNISLIKRLRSLARPSQDQILFKFAENCSERGEEDLFKNFQKLLIENLEAELCSFEFNLSNVYNEPVLEVVYFIAGEEDSRESVLRRLNNKIKAFYETSNRGPLSGLLVSVEDIKNHAAWNFKAAESGLDQLNSAPGDWE